MARVLLLIALKMPFKIHNLLKALQVSSIGYNMRQLALKDHI